MKNKNYQIKENPGNSGKDKGTFIIIVEHCQNDTWQGRITWAEENKKVAFRSALEMVKLMNEALEKLQAKQEHKSENSVS